MATLVIDELVKAADLSEEVAHLAEQVRTSVVVVRGSRFGSGSGVVWNDQGLVVTNHHVAPGDRAEVTSRRGDRLAALRVEARWSPGDLEPATIGDSAGLRVGELVMAVGNPHGERNAVTLGVVSGNGVAAWFARPREVIQVAINLRPGNSGGALADAQGQVVGIPNMVIGPGIALAVPSHVVERFLLESDRKTGWFGLGGQYVELPQAVAKGLGLASNIGILLTMVAPESPAERAGLTIGDIIIDVSIRGSNGSSPDLFGRLGNAPAGQPVELGVVRGGELRKLEVTPT